MKKPINRLRDSERSYSEPILFFLLFLTICLLLPGRVLAAGEWAWQFNLASPAEKEPFVMPIALYVETESKRFYVVDAGGSSLHSFQFDGVYLNSFSPGADALQQPFAMLRVAKSGQLWVVEKGRNSLTKVDLKEKKMTPVTLAYDGLTVYPDRFSLVDDKVYVLDKSTGNIIAFDLDLHPSGVYRSSGNGFIDFVVKNSELWALDAKLKKVFQFDLAGKLKSEISLKDKVSFPVAVEVGPSGFVYIIDKHEGSIVVFDAAGDFKYSFLKKGHGNNNLYYPEDIVFDPLGRLCVVDTGNGRVGVFSR